jgi:hypothetical protein
VRALVQGAPGPRFRVVGTGATYTAESDDGQADRLLAGRFPAVDGKACGTVPPQGWGRLYRAEGDSGEPVPAERGRWSTFYSMLARARRGEGDLPVDPWDSVAALAVLGAARVSATRREVVAVETGGILTSIADPSGQPPGPGLRSVATGGGGPVDDRTTSAGARRRVPAVPLSPASRAVSVRPASCPTSAIWLSMVVNDNRCSLANTVLS